MTFRTLLTSRLAVLLVALVFLGVGGFALAWAAGFDPARAAWSHLDRPQVSDVPDQSWWPAALWGLLTLGVVSGIVLLASNLSRRKPARIRLHDADSATTVFVDLDAVADGVADALRSLDGVRTCHARVSVERRLPTATVTVTAAPTADVGSLAAHAQRQAWAVASAVAGGRVALQVLLHLDPLGRDDGSRSDAGGDTAAEHPGGRDLATDPDPTTEEHR